MIIRQGFISALYAAINSPIKIILSTPVIGEYHVNISSGIVTEKTSTYFIIKTDESCRWSAEQ